MISADELHEGSCNHICPRAETKKTKSEKRKPFYKTNKITMWVFYVAWLVALGYTMFNISKSVDKYLSKPVSTKITVYHNEDGTMSFPTVSLCNLNWVSKSYLDKDVVLSSIYHNISTGIPVDWDDSSVDARANTPYQDIFRNSPDWSETMLFCAYAGVRRCQDMSVFLNQSDFVEEELSMTGKCFRFNPNGKLRSKAGDYGSVYLRLNINLNEYIDKSENGILMAIHHHTQYSSTRNTGIIMSPGFKYRVNIKTLMRSELPVEKGGKCNAKLETNSYGAYDLESCHTECRDKALNSSCGCIPILPPKNIHNYRACTMKEMGECANTAYYRFVLDESNTEVNHNTHNCGCWVPCKHYSYELSTATTAISREYAESKANSKEGKRLNFTTDDVLNNNIKLEMYFRDMYVQEISQIPEYDFWNLLADIGGMLGLFLGASIFTIIDFIRYILNYTFMRYKERCGTDINKPNTNESSSSNRDKSIQNDIKTNSSNIPAAAGLSHNNNNSNDTNNRYELT